MSQIKEMAGNREVDFVEMGKGPGGRSEDRTGSVIMIQRWYLYSPIPQDECNYYVSQTLI